MRLTSAQLKELRRTPVGEGGNRVAKAIDLAKVTQAAVAAATSLTQPYVSDVARGRHSTITVENASAFAVAFGCSIEDLFPITRAEAVGA